MYLRIKFILSLLDIQSKYKVYFFTVARILLGLLDLIGVLLIGALLARAVNGLESGNTSGTSKLPFVNFVDSISIIQIALVASVAFILKSVLSAVFTRYMFSTLALTEAKLATNSFSYLLNNMSWTIKRYSKSDLNYLLSGSILATMQILASFVSIVSDIFFLILILISFAIVDLGATLFILIYFSIISFTLHAYLGKRFENSGKISLDAGITVTTLIYDTVQSFREVISLNRETFFLKKFRNKKHEGSKASFYVQFLNNLPRYIVESALVIGALGIIYFSYQPNNPEESAQTIGIFLTGAMRIMSSLLPLQTALANYKHQNALSEKFIEFEELTGANKNFKQKIVQKSKKIKLTEPVGIRVENLTYSYEDSNAIALRNININVEPGKLVAIIGPSGSGKSTLADLLIGIYQPSQGEIRYYTKTDENLPKQEFKVGYVSQNPGKIYGTIRDNIAFGQDAADVDFDSLKDAIKISHLTDLISSLDSGHDTHLGEQTDSLSGGQMQRIGLARAIYVKPNLLILDEATSALDVESESAITESLNSLRGTCTIVVIAHRLATVQNADIVFVMNEGHIIASGKFADLAQSNEMVSRFVELSELSTN